MIDLVVMYFTFSLSIVLTSYFQFSLMDVTTYLRCVMMLIMFLLCKISILCAHCRDISLFNTLHLVYSGGLFN
jgi:hypothetical protein